MNFKEKVTFTKNFGFLYMKNSQNYRFLNFCVTYLIEKKLLKMNDFKKISCSYIVRDKKIKKFPTLRKFLCSYILRIKLFVKMHIENLIIDYKHKL